MRAEFIHIAPATQSIDPELVFTFRISEIEKDKIPIRIGGDLFTEDNLKIGVLKDADYRNVYANWLNADGASNAHANTPFDINLTCGLSAKAINTLKIFVLKRRREQKMSSLRHGSLFMHWNPV